MSSARSERPAGIVVLSQVLEAALVAAPAAAVGCAAGVLATYGAAARLLTLLNEPPPGAALALPLLASWLAGGRDRGGGAAWPAWRAAARPVVSLLRGADVAPARAARPVPAAPRAPAGLAALGARLVAARRARLAATVITLGLSAGFVLLLLVAGLRAAARCRPIPARWASATS